MKNDLRSCPENGVSSESLMVQVSRKGMGRVAVVLLAALCIFGVVLSDAQAEEPALTPESIKQSNPELYRRIQAAPKLPEENVDPDKPYDAYPGFFAQPVLKPGQIEEWWENSSFDYSPMYPYLLKHTHMKFSFARSTGNDDGSVTKGGLLLALRKDRVTNVIGYEIDKKDITSTDGSSTHKDIQSFEETALYELNRYLFVEAGMFWQRLSQQFIKDRYLPFAGFGSYNVLQDVLNKKKDRLGLRLGYGRVTDVYDPVVVNIIHKDSDSFNGIYTRADYTHKFSDLLTYKQHFVMKHATDATPRYSLTTIPQTQDQKSIVIGTTKRYDWRWTNSLEFALNQYVGFLISYEVAFDSNPWPIAVKRDTEFMTGFKFAY
ncbi:MAG: hypothetical protein WC007_07650 [Pelobacteraceae bacterium]